MSPPNGACTGVPASATASGGEAYPSYSECLGACTSLPIKYPISETNQAINMSVVSGDSFECRYHAAFQAGFDYWTNTGVILTDCIVAGNFGGDLPGLGLTLDTCGTACDFYCDEMVGGMGTAPFNLPGHCLVASAGFTPYTSYANCLSVCQTTLNLNRLGSGDLLTGNIVGTNTLECRIVQAGLAQNASITAAACLGASVSSFTNKVLGCLPATASSSTGAAHHSSSTGLSAATNLQVSIVGLLACIVAAFALMRR